MVSLSLKSKGLLISHCSLLADVGESPASSAVSMDVFTAQPPSASFPFGCIFMSTLITSVEVHGGQERGDLDETTLPLGLGDAASARRHSQSCTSSLSSSSTSSSSSLSVSSSSVCNRLYSPVDTSELFTFPPPPSISLTLIDLLALLFSFCCVFASAFTCSISLLGSASSPVRCPHSMLLLVI